mgnify:CR=1 FL=1
MVLLGLSLAVGTPAATNMFPVVSAQTVQAARKNRNGHRSPESGIFTKNGVKQNRLADLGRKKILSEMTDGTMKANE